MLTILVIFLALRGIQAQCKSFMLWKKFLDCPNGVNQVVVEELGKCIIVRGNIGLGNLQLDRSTLDDFDDGVRGCQELWTGGNIWSIHTENVSLI